MLKTEAETIIIYDSGVGGLNLIDRLGSCLCRLRTVFIADNDIFPLGRFSESAVRERCFSMIMQGVRKYDAKYVVLACNTAATACLSELQQLLAIPVFGVFPDIGGALARSYSKSVALLATPSTIQREFVKAFVRANGPRYKIACLGSLGLVKLAHEKMLGHRVEMSQILRELCPLWNDPTASRIDTVILACTHFWALREEIAVLLHVDASSICDPADQLATQLIEFFSNDGDMEKQSAPADLRFALTGDEDSERLSQAFRHRGFQRDQW